MKSSNVAGMEHPGVKKGLLDLDWGGDVQEGCINRD
jgi:hypothetical protein